MNDNSASKKLILVILDGWGMAVDSGRSAIAAAKTPVFNRIWKEYAHSRLEASGLAVGLPEGQMGNSEVGHMNIGAGRVVYQDLVKINLEAEKGGFEQHPLLAEALQQALAREQFVQGPFIESLPDFRKSRSIHGLKEEGVLDPAWERMIASGHSHLYERKLYSHQDDAI